MVVPTSSVESVLSGAGPSQGQSVKVLLGAMRLARNDWIQLSDGGWGLRPRCRHNGQRKGCADR